MEFHFVPLQCPRLTYKCVGLSMDQSNHIKQRPSSSMSDGYFDKHPKIIISNNMSREDTTFPVHSISEFTLTKSQCSKLLTVADDVIPECDEAKTQNREISKTPSKFNHQDTGKRKSGLLPDKNGLFESGYANIYVSPFKATIYRPINLLDADLAATMSAAKKVKRFSDTSVRLNHENIHRWLLEHGIKSKLRSFSSSNFQRACGVTGANTTSLEHATSKSHDGRLHDLRRSLVMAERLRLAFPPSSRFRHSLGSSDKSMVSLFSLHRLSSIERPVSADIHSRIKSYPHHHKKQAALRSLSSTEQNSDPLCHGALIKASDNNYNDSTHNKVTKDDVDSDKQTLDILDSSLNDEQIRLGLHQNSTQTLQHEMASNNLTAQLANSLEAVSNKKVVFYYISPWFSLETECFHFHYFIIVINLLLNEFFMMRFFFVGFLCLYGK